MGEGRWVHDLSVSKTYNDLPWTRYGGMVMGKNDSIQTDEQVIKPSHILASATYLVYLVQMSVVLLKFWLHQGLINGHILCIRPTYQFIWACNQHVTSPEESSASTNTS